jgi:signal transduction histidine kinase
MNILSNAIDALRSQEPSLPTSHYPSPIITIETTVQDAIATQPAYVCITIRDNGPGILPEYQPKLFDPFFTTKPIGEGTGLGLAISYKIVTEHHNGTLHCESVPGQHTLFTIRIPVNSAEQDSSDRSSSVELSSSR